jgi:hypothetical protein
VRFEFESGTVLICFCFIFVLFGESCLLVLWCAGAAWHATMRTVTGVGDLMQRTGDSHIGRVLGGRTIEKSGGDVCGLHQARGD